MKRMIRAAEGEASSSARDNFDDKMDQIQDNFDYAIDGISKIAADGNLAQAEDLLTRLNSVIDEAIGQITGSISSGTESEPEV